MLHGDGIDAFVIRADPLGGLPVVVAARRCGREPG
jgi:hypothetical protein